MTLREWNLIDFTKEFKYLGSIISSSLYSADDVTHRIGKATKVFGALKKKVFASRRVRPQAKVALYTAFVLSTLLYGSECWALLKKDQDRLERLHRRCVRTMTGISSFMQWKRHKTSEELNQRLGLHSMEHYLQVRALRWLGHIVRMDYPRLPRQLLFGWVRHPRLSCGHRITYGIRMQRVLKTALRRARPEVRRAIEGRRGVGWFQFAQQRANWCQLVHAGSGDRHERH